MDLLTEASELPDVSQKIGVDKKSSNMQQKKMNERESTRSAGLLQRHTANQLEDSELSAFGTIKVQASKQGKHWEGFVVEKSYWETRKQDETRKNP